MLEALGLGLWVGPSPDDAEAAWPAVPEGSIGGPVPSRVEGSAPVAGAGAEAATRCATCPGRMVPIEPRGAASPAWLVVGGVPEPEDVSSGRAFAGAPGELLQRMLAAIGLPSGDAPGGAGLMLAVRCAPAEGRVPGPEQLAACSVALRAEVERLRPRVVLALGRTAARALLGADDAVGRRRGTVQRIGATPVVVTHELPYLLRHPEAKREAWDDLCLAREVAVGSSAPPAH